jgi:hypothetical protein
MLSPMVDQIRLIRHLRRMREGVTDGFGKPDGAIPADHRNSERLASQGNTAAAVRSAKRSRSVPISVMHEKGRVRVSSLRRTVVSSSTYDSRSGWIWDGSHVTEEGRRLSWKCKPGSQALTDLGRSRASNGVAPTRYTTNCSIGSPGFPGAIFSLKTASHFSKTKCTQRKKRGENALREKQASKDICSDRAL